MSRRTRSPVHGSGRSVRTGVSSRIRSGIPSARARSRIWAATWWREAMTIAPGQVPDGPADRAVEIGHDDLRCAGETAEEGPPGPGVLGARDGHQARRRAAALTVEGDQDRAGAQVACAGFGRVVRGGSEAAGEQGRRVEHDDPRPAGRVRGQDRRGERVEVVDREVGLAARPANARAQDVLAQVGAGGPQAHALPDPDQQARDLGVAEHEVAAGRDALVTGVHVLTGGARGTRVGMVPGRLADSHWHAERVPPGAWLGHAPIAGPPVGVAPAAALEAVQPDATVRVSRTGRPHHGRVEGRAWHAPTVAVGPDISTVTRARLFPARSNGGWSGRRGSNPRHAAWKAGTAMRNSTVLSEPSVVCPVIVSRGAALVSRPWSLTGVRLCLLGVAPPHHLRGVHTDPAIEEPT